MPGALRRAFFMSGPTPHKPEIDPRCTGREASARIANRRPLTRPGDCMPLSREESI